MEGSNAPSIENPYRPFLGVKLVHAYPCQNDGADGYNIRYADGYVSWCPKDVFESAYFRLTLENSITMGDVKEFMGDVESHRLDPKTCLVKAEYKTGFVQYNTSSCVDPENYDEEIGRVVGIQKLQDNLFFALGFVLQWGRKGLKATKN